MNGMNPQVITKLDELRNLVGGTGKSATFSVHEDAEGGISYSSTSADGSGNSVQITERRAPKRAPISSPPAANAPNNNNPNNP